MGTGFDVNGADDQVGIIPRAVHYLFEGINVRRQNAVNESLPEPMFSVTAEFLELYNEDIYDLFDSSSDTRKKSMIKIHEDSNGVICTQGVDKRKVSSYNEVKALSHSLPLTLRQHTKKERSEKEKSTR